MSRTAAQRDFAALERHAQALLDQCAHHRRHVEAGREDGVRALYMQRYANAAAKVAGRMARRFEKSRAQR